jgi:hypothetical protein
MARGTTLLNLRLMLKAEIGDNSGTNATADATLNVLLSNMQKWLATEYDWPFLERRFNVSAPANTQYLSFPTSDDVGDNVGLNLERFPLVYVLWNTKYQPVQYGISIDEYNTMNYAALQQQSDPIQRWRAATNPNEATNPNAFEVWPVPVTAQTMLFTGQRVVKALAVDADTADLDDMMLVMFTAAERLSRLKQPDAREKAEKANRRLAFVRQAYPTRDRIRCMDGAGEAEFKRQRRLVGMTIAVH